MAIKIEMVEIPSSQDQKINSFAIGKYPVTQEQYQSVMGNNPSHFQGNPQNPVERVSYDDAVAFCEKLSEMTGKNYRLPTESEWEYACRAGTTTRWYFGNNYRQSGDYAWYGGNSEDTTHPVGQKLPNAWGLYDMIGNVYEWCQSAILRGGSYLSHNGCCDSTFCINAFNDYIYCTNGFRVAETIRPTLLAEEMWEADMSEPYKDMILSEVVEYLETLQTKEEKKKFLTAIYWSSFQACLEHEDDCSGS